MELTPEQQALEARLRDWRTAEAERLNLPQFFVFGSSVLRELVLRRPLTLAELAAVPAMDREKVERYGEGILAVCNS